MGRAFSSMPSYRSSGILALVVPQVRHFYCLSIGFCPYFAPSHQVSPRGLFVAKHALKYIQLVHTCLLAWVWMISLDTRSFSPRLSVLSYPAISANACLVTLILSHVSFISFLALKHLHELAILTMRTHVCRALVRVCTYSFFSIVHCLKYSCFVSARKCTH